MSDETVQRANQNAFARPDVVASYDRDAGLTEVESMLLLDLALGADILDLGVGAGRTTAELARRARSYIGLDVAEPMLEVARRRHPGQSFVLGDASDLGSFATASFDLVVFSYNGIDYLHPVEARLRCMAEMARVVRPGGHVVLSSHHVYGIVKTPTTWTPADVTRSLAMSSVRFARLARSGALLRGGGYVRDGARDTLVTYYTSTRRMRRWAARFGLQMTQMVPTSSSGSRHRRYAAPWIYYAFRRLASGEPSPCRRQPTQPLPEQQSVPSSEERRGKAKRR